jgi:alkylation response protein AidB-like acyl-CoA dehydrogenase
VFLSDFEPSGERPSGFGRTEREFQFEKANERRDTMNNYWKLDEEGSRLLATADKVTREVIQPLAATIDEEARFPKENIDAMRQAGLLALVSAKSVGAMARDSARR